ncbi:ABC transporter permease [Anaerofilum sp. BX8]|uniref:ABC transporter permease n=1 Tax=Anaerofilum hominis TaxID=2763016 RepID=A0A923L1P3_9FIRM|nr:ABC transporter permease [Anaerofilum hominis]MBC5582158.1 ABC transporter permease [Anaerofilum hominis]
MKRYVLMRVLKALLTIWAVYTLVFFLTRVTGDPVEWLTIAGASDSAKETLRQNLGLDLPLVQQYFKSLFGLFTGDTGTSYYYARSVSDLFAERIGPTLSLGAIVMALTILIGVPLGMLAAVRHNTLLDRGLMSLAIVGNTMPNFILGILLIFIFSLKLRALPSGGMGTPLHYILPVIAMAVGPTASVARLTRSSLLDVIGQDHLDCARAKGMREWNVVLKHGMRNALIPVITILGGQLSAMIGGSVVVETVFAWPGIGTLIVTSAQQRDFPVVVFGVLVIAASVTFVNLLVDLSYGLLDPRIRDSH